MGDKIGYCTTTCQLHDDKAALIEKHETTIFGKDREGGIITTVELILAKILIIERLIYGLVGLSMTGLLVYLGKILIMHGGTK